MASFSFKFLTSYYTINSGEQQKIVKKNYLRLWNQPYPPVGEADPRLIELENRKAGMLEENDEYQQHQC